jgi:hypothetical protein
MEIDNDLRQAREMIPERLRVRPIAECGNDPANLIMARFGVREVACWVKAEIL